MSHFHLKNTVAVQKVGPVEVSTVDLSLPEYGIVGKGYETCLFWKGDSEVVEWYATQSQAEQGHARWLEVFEPIQRIVKESR